MAGSYIRENIANGVAFTTIIDSKFKTNLIAVRFISPLSKNSASANSLAISLLSSANSKFQTQTDFSRKLNTLYGASMNDESLVISDYHILSLCSSAIDSKFAIDNEDIIGEQADLLCDCVFSPAFKDGKFESTLFKQKKQSLLDAIDSEINEKRIYAIRSAKKVIYEGEPCENTSRGTREVAESLNEEIVTNAYNDMIKKSRIEIFFIGNGDSQSVKEKFTKAFNSIEREPIDYKYRSQSALKPEPRIVKEELDINQTKLVMAFKSDNANSYANKLFVAILGETPFSKLFSNVREKLSLCYYCAARYDEAKSVMMIDSGVETANTEKAKLAILNEIKSMQEGNFTDDEMANTVLSIADAYKGLSDTGYGLLNWYFTRTVRGDLLSPSEELKKIQAVTREDIIEAAKSFKLDTVFAVTEKGAK